MKTTSLLALCFFLSETRASFDDRILQTKECSNSPTPIACASDFDCPGTCHAPSPSPTEGDPCTPGVTVCLPDSGELAGRGQCVGEFGTCVSTVAPEATTPAPTPSTPAPTPSTPAPTPSTPAPTPSTPAPTPSTPAPTPSTPAPTPSTPAPTPATCTSGPSLEEALLSEDIFGPVGPQCNYVPTDGEYSFTFDLSSLPSFNDGMANIESVLFEAHMSHTDANANRTWEIRIGSGGNLYSYKGAFGEAMPPNVHDGKHFVDEVWQKVGVDLVKNSYSQGFFVHQGGVYQDQDPGYTDKHPYWFSPSLAIHCSTIVPECSFASLGQQSLPRFYTERIIFYDRYRDCGNGVVERTQAVHNAEPAAMNSVLDFINLPWFGTDAGTLKDIEIATDDSNWNHNGWNLTTREDPMPLYGVHYNGCYSVISSQIFNNCNGVPDHRVGYSAATKGYTVFAQDLRFPEYPSTPAFQFPGRLPPDENQLRLLPGYGWKDNDWLCQRLDGAHWSPPVTRCRLNHPKIDLSATEKHYNLGCTLCNLVFTNNINSASIDVHDVLHWAHRDEPLTRWLIYFYTDASMYDVRQVFQDGSEIFVNWKETGKRDEDNLAMAFVHGKSTEALETGNNNPSKFRYGLANNVERRYNVFEYIAADYDVAFEDTLRARQYLIADNYVGLGSRAEAYVPDATEELIEGGQLTSTQIDLYDDSGNTFGAAVGGAGCCRADAVLRCSGSSTPQVGKVPLVQISCGTNTYVGKDIYRFTPYPGALQPNDFQHMYNCTIGYMSSPTADRPVFKLLGYFTPDDCGSVQNKVYASDFCG